MTAATPVEEPLVEILPGPADPDEVARYQARRARYDRNWEWFQTHVVELGKTLFDRYVCVAGQQCFTGTTVLDAVAAAKAAHPADDGRFTDYFPAHRLPRVYVRSR